MQTKLKIYITRPKYDNIAKILDILNIKYTRFNKKYDCDLLFLNCGTTDVIDKKELNKFVENGGVLYASDLTSGILVQSFKDIFNFEGKGHVCTLATIIEDSELRQVIGNEIDIYFNMDGWSVLKSINKGKVILKSKYDNKPLMVEIPYGKGKIFYTCFHNHAQSNEKESILLRLLVLKQISEVTNTNIEETSDNLNINLSDYKKVFFENLADSETFDTLSQKEKEEKTSTNEKQDVWDTIKKNNDNKQNISEQENNNTWDSFFK